MPIVPPSRFVEPWSQFVVITPTASLNEARVTAAPVTNGGEAAVTILADSVCSATTTLPGTASQWGDTATVADSTHQ